MAINIKLKESLENRMHNGDRIQDAMDIFRVIIYHNELESHTIKGWGKDVLLPFLVDPEGWLAIWMLRSDEISISLFGHKIWDSAYKADKHCVEGVKPIPLSSINNSVESVDTYKRYTLAEKSGIPFSIRYLICQQALFDSLIIINKEVEIKPVRGLYDLKGKLEAGQLLPMPDEPRVYGQQLNKIICRLNAARTIDKSPSLELENSDNN